jgi:hypothetical protein
MILFFVVWFILGIAGALIYNSFMNYENTSLKYIWNILVIVCGGFGFLFSILHWIGVKIIK